MTLEEKVTLLRIKIAERRRGIRVFIDKGNHAKWYEDSLKYQEADFIYFEKELDRLLQNVEV